MTPILAQRPHAPTVPRRKEGERLPPPSGRMYATPRPLMRRHYLVRSNKALAFLSATDTVLRIFAAGCTAAHPPNEPRRILVANWAHIGDVLTSLPTLRALREKFPSATIDMIVSRAGRVAAEQSGLCDHLHTIDHFVLNRSNRPRLSKLRVYLEDRRRFLRAAARQGYDVAIDLYPYFPPAAPLFRQAGIPVRCGFTSGGYGPLLTHPVTWTYQDKPIGQYGHDLIAAVWPDWIGPTRWLPPHRPRLTVSPSSDDGFPIETPYIVVHVGTGASYREWPEANWIRLVNLWGSQAPLLVFCGKGAEEGARARRIADHAGHGRAMIFLDREWDELTSLLAGAAGLVCLESSAGHLAAAFSLPTVAIYSGTNEHRLWGPDNVNARVLSAPTGCAPCHRGCDAMA